MQLKFWFYTQLHMYTYTLLSKNMNASKRGHTPSSEENAMMGTNYLVCSYNCFLTTALKK